MSEKPLFRTSYTILDLFDRGRIDDALLCQFGLWEMLPTNAGILAGREWHERWAKETLKTGSMPEVFGGAKLGAPVIEQKFEVEIGGWLKLVFKADVIDGTRIKEYKTGAADSLSYLNKKQLPLYAALLEQMKRPIQMGEIHHYNQYTDKVDVSYIWLTKTTKAEALLWAILTAQKLKKYIEENKVTLQTLTAVAAKP